MPPIEEDLINSVQAGPESYDWVTYAWVILVSFWGGIARYMKRVSMGLAVKFSWPEFIADITTSGFVGLITFMICEWRGFDKMLSGAIIGISAHMGSRALFLIERLLIDVIKSRGTGK